MLMPEAPASKLVRAIGRWSLGALVVNFIIGAGIFGLPSAAARILGGQSPFAYLMAAAGMSVIAACVAEVASRFRQAGGPYLYAKAPRLNKLCNSNCPEVEVNSSSHHENLLVRG